jgi:hypothetical protein
MSNGKFGGWSGGERGQTPEMVAAELRRAFPGYEVTIRWDQGVPRFQLRSRDLASLYCLISADAQEIRRELEGHPSGRLAFLIDMERH